MNDDTGTAFHHGRDKRAVQPYGRHEIQVDFPQPFRVAKRPEAAGRRRRPAEHVYEDIDLSQTVPGRGNKAVAAFGRRQVGRDKEVIRHCGRLRACGCQDLRAELAEEGHTCRPRPAGTGRDQNPFAVEIEKTAHAPISNSTIRPSERRKAKERSAGLPGKRPVTMARTMMRSWSCRTLCGTDVF